VDPMHSLYLGTGKHLLKTYIERGILSGEDLRKITLLLQEVRKKAPEEVGRIPRTMLETEDIDNLTADEMKNFYLCFAAPLLKDFLPREDLEVLSDFVDGCVFLSTRVLSHADLLRADNALLSFCRKAEARYGDDFCTPNMHMQLHIATCIEDYGPIYSFWLFGFERYNGMVGSFFYSNRSVEEEIMRKISRHSLLNAIDLDNAHLALVEPVLNKEQRGALELEVISEDVFLAYVEAFDPSVLFIGSSPFGVPEGKTTYELFNNQMASHLYEFYSKTYDNSIEKVFFRHPSVTVFHTLRIGSERFDSLSRKVNRSYILTSFEKDGRSCIYAAQIMLFFRHNIKENGRTCTFTFVVAQFFKPGKQQLGSFPHDLQHLEHIWNSEERYQISSDSFLPAQKILCSFVPLFVAPFKFRACPLPRKFAY